MTTTRTWSGRWICGRPVYQPQQQPAPYLRQTFTLDKAPSSAIAYVCTGGWHELYVNGLKVDDRVLAPTISQFDRHLGYIAYDIAWLLRPGRNAIVAHLGNGLYNCQTSEVWNFVNAYWRDSPKLLCDIVVDGALVAKSDATWKAAPSPVIFDAMRNGETYDCSLEVAGFADADLDDSGWRGVELCNPPGGIPILEEQEPTRICHRYRPAAITRHSDQSWLIDFGTNLTGWTEITLRNDGSSHEPASVRLIHTEHITEDGQPDARNINSFIKSGDCQTDTVILRPEPGVTVFHPHFTYHGYRYTTVTASHPGVTIELAEGCFIHNDFPQIGTFDSSDETLNRLQQLTMQSYLCNFTGIPTDCPHREKNGWTGDAQLAAETGLWNYDGTRAYNAFMQTFADTQRPSGQFPGIAPSAGWGYNWGSGPAWDSIIFELAWQLRRFRNDSTIITQFYQNMKDYLAYCESMANDDLVSFGLGDWCAFDQSHAPTTRLTSSAYVYCDALRFAEFAALTGHDEDAAAARGLAQRIRAAVQREFDNHDGSWANDSVTALACVLYYRLCQPEQETELAARLADKVRAFDHKTDFGILGAKWTPRALAEHGYGTDAFLLVTQPEYPGWANWIRQGATTLQEHWNGSSSQNHIMFGDISAWMYEFLGGLSPDFHHPGFARVTFSPCLVPQLNRVDVSYRAPNGTLAVHWERQADGSVDIDLDLPEGTVADVRLPGLAPADVTGKQHFHVKP